MRIEIEVPGGDPVILDDAVLAGGALDRGEPPDAPPVRLVFAAAHVILRESYGALPHSPEVRGDPEELAEHLDWERTLAFRRHLDAQGLGVAEAMDTAQRFELGWPTARRLIEECGRLDLECGFVAGAGSDQRKQIRDQGALVDAVTEQVAFIAAQGGIPIILPMPQLCAWSLDADEFVEVYDAIIRGGTGPCLIHWLGPMFLPELAGYFPGDSFDRVMDLDPEIVRGVKMSLLDPDLELRVRARCRQREQIVLTGDDLHFAALIEGNGPPERTVPLGDQAVPEGDFSHALLGVLDGAAVPAGRALRHLAAGDVAGYRSLIGPCERFGQIVFESPTEHYKAGLAFTAWLNGHQPNRWLVNRQDRRRDRAHLLEVARRASTAGCIESAELAAERLRFFIAEEV